MNLQTTQLVIVEDDFVDAEAIRRGVMLRKLQFTIEICREGQSALNFMRELQKQSEDPIRQIVLLDINMPGMNGHEFLQELRSDPELRRSIVFVLTTSEHPRDRSLAYDKNIAGYFVKSSLEPMLDLLASYDRAVLYPPKNRE